MWKSWIIVIPIFAGLSNAAGKFFFLPEYAVFISFMHMFNLYIDREAETRDSHQTVYS